jgi:hypothetical protein
MAEYCCGLLALFSGVNACALASSDAALAGRIRGELLRHYERVFTLVEHGIFLLTVDVLSLGMLNASRHSDRVPLVV